MPLSSPEDFTRLGEHLMALDHIILRFCRESGYIDQTGVLGRYPHRSLCRHDEVERKIDLQMELAENGQRYDAFFPEIPYSLWAGAWLDEDGIRYCGKGTLIFERFPFQKIEPILLDALRDCEKRLSSVTALELRNHGTRTKLGKT